VGSGVLGIFPFLAINKPLTGGSLVVEGWVSVIAFKDLVAEFKRGHYEKILVVGVPLEQGAKLSIYPDYAHVGAAVLLQLGLDTNVIEAVPAPDSVQDRVYAAGVGLEQWRVRHGISPSAMRITLAVEGPHARRARLLFRKALPKEMQVGVLALPVDDYDPDHWWRTSAGVRTVLGEAIGWFYARLFFHPGPATPAGSPASNSTTDPPRRVSGVFLRTGYKLAQDPLRSNLVIAGQTPAVGQIPSPSSALVED
jgi:hypothetical protein